MKGSRVAMRGDGQSTSTCDEILIDKE
jgi:hypothetical protein